MSFWSGLGKILLKAAPIAASFIPGVGPVASALIGAGTGAASGALSGGKSGALKGGIEGGLTGYGASKVKGLGPSKVPMGGEVNNLIDTKQSGRGWQDLLGDILPALGGGGTNDAGTGNLGTGRAPEPASRTAVTRPGLGPMPRGGFSYDENPLNQYDQSNPNLSMALHQGRQEAKRQIKRPRVTAY